MSFLKKTFHYFIPLLADFRYGHPGKKMVVIGVTGTNGKSTTCRFIASVLQAGGYKVGLMSTVEFQIGDKRWLNDRKMSMLGRGEIQKMLKQMAGAGCQYAVIETSSEGILQYRHLGIHYDIAVFTNLGTEHSERHGGFENLRRDKGRLFAGLKKEMNKHLTMCKHLTLPSPPRGEGKRVKKIIIANADDAQAEYFLSFPADEKWVYGLNQNLKIPAKGGSASGEKYQNDNVKFKIIDGEIVASDGSGTEFMCEGGSYQLNIVGEFNVPNALAAIAVGKSQGISEESIASGLKSVKIIEGRMEFVEAGQNFKVVVDYAHEPLSLTALFTTLRRLVGPHNKVIGLVGSDGGGRDKGKRAKMGEIAGQLCDYVIITDVNCFDEDPAAIAEMLAIGARQAGKKDKENLFVEIDRRAGIAKAMALASAGDMVAITAKGSEPCICVANGQKIPWDDRKVAKEVLITRVLGCL